MNTALNTESRLPRLIVTDLDNTLYDWVTYFSTSFYAMIDVLEVLLPVDREVLLDEFRRVHQAHSNSEHPFALLEVPSVKDRFEGRTTDDILAALAPATKAFSDARATHLHLYDGVMETLQALTDRGVIVVAHTEAVVANAFFRLEALGVRRFIKRLYALDARLARHPRGGSRFGDPPPSFVSIVDPSERKPNPRLLQDICAREGVPIEESWYVGDSLTRDMSMAVAAGMTAIWARYGTVYERSQWDRLVRVTHWTAADVEREQRLRSEFAGVRPTFTIDRFPDLLRLPQAAT